ncbi:hypothetical protein AB0L65_50425 [Nonomuraea sp. NPDC052116]|uniref:hypothetical protein n=1 Tax=Nonomuraea sp. NPDC052116 TaxID=3155665 RepID=UPI0034293153
MQKLDGDRLTVRRLPEVDDALVASPNRPTMSYGPRPPPTADSPSPPTAPTDRAKSFQRDSRDIHARDQEALVFTEITISVQMRTNVDHSTFLMVNRKGVRRFQRGKRLFMAMGET